MEEVITENFSENKRKRGRPLKELYPGSTRKELIDMYESSGLVSELKSQRGKENFYYFTGGMRALSYESGSVNLPEDGEFSFIATESRLKKTILQELGRLEDSELIRSVAKVICDNKLSTEKAIIYIRKFRVDQKQGDSFELAILILKVIETYSSKHVGVDSNLMISSIDIAKKAITENFSENSFIEVA